MTQLKQFPLRQPRRPALGLWLVLALLVAPLRATPAAANVVITDCTTSLDLAVALNGPNALITFSCGPAPVTITITQDGGFNVVDGSAFTIDGGNRVTLSGGNNNRVFNVAATAALTLTNIILNHGYAASGGPSPVDEGGALLNNGGTLALINTIVRDSQSTHAGGALENQSGTTTLVNSLIENNQSKFGGGIDSLGTLTLIHSTVRGNTALDAGGGLDISGTVVIDNSQIVGNKANGALANGGGIDSQGTLEITNSTLSGNSSGQNGGGLRKTKIVRDSSQ